MRTLSTGIVEYNVKFQLIALQCFLAGNTSKVDLGQVNGMKVFSRQTLSFSV
jgi:hypothetical protein